MDIVQMIGWALFAAGVLIFAAGFAVGFSLARFAWRR